MKRPPTSLAGAELRATLLVDNVQAPPEPRDAGIGLPEVAFALGAQISPIAPPRTSPPARPVPADRPARRVPPRASSPRSRA